MPHRVRPSPPCTAADGSGAPIRKAIETGPIVRSGFEVVGVIVDAGCVDANPAGGLAGLRALPVGPGDGVRVGCTVEEPGEHLADNHAPGQVANGVVAVRSAS